ncbi:MAG: TraB/GumN family protein [Bacteroidota bacterium]
MKKIFLAFVCLLWLTTTYAQKNNSLLWAISGNGLKTPSYLFGTYHFAGRSLVDSLSETKKYFNLCKTVVGEVIVDSAALQRVASAMMLTDGTTLSTLYTPEEFKLIGDYVKQISNMDIMGLNTLKPATLQIMLMSFTVPKTFSDTNPPVDLYFQQEGKRLNYKVTALETLDEQIALVCGAPIAEQKKDLLESVTKKDIQNKDANELFALYLKQDLDGVEKLVNAGLAKSSSPEMSDKMLKDRNLKWIIKIPEIIKEQPAFIAVGAAHLVGQYGLINQLRLKGYTVLPVKI